MELLALVIFLFCAAMAAGSTLLLTRLIQEYKLPFLRSLFYYIIFIFAFGFYGVWGQFLIVSVAGKNLTPELLSSISVISLLLGLPFLIFGWLMLLQFAAETRLFVFKGIYTGTFLVFNFGILIVLGFFIKDSSFDDALPVIKYYYASASTLFSVIAALLLLSGKECSVKSGDCKVIAIIIVAGTLAQAVAILFIHQEVWMAMTFVFLIFSSTSLMIIFMSYKAEMQVLHYAIPDQPPAGIEDFFRKYDISPREADIIREICNGLSNQETADKLFISLQTVKDHTSRIYSKINVRSRMQLMNLVQTSSKN